MPDKDNATSSKGSEDPVHEVPSPFNSPKCPPIGDGSIAKTLTLSIQDLIHPDFRGYTSFDQRLWSPASFPGLVSFADPNPLLKDAAHFIMEFNGYVGMLFNSIYD